MHTHTSGHVSKHAICTAKGKTTGSNKQGSTYLHNLPAKKQQTHKLNIFSLAKSWGFLKQIVWK